MPLKNASPGSPACSMTPQFRLLSYATVESVRQFFSRDSEFVMLLPSGPP